VPQEPGVLGHVLSVTQSVLCGLTAFRNDPAVIEAQEVCAYSKKSEETENV
jgi:hypothetical protein